MKTLSAGPASEQTFGGFGVLDDKGRVSLPVNVRRALGIEAGSHVAFLVIAGQLLVVPQDRQLIEPMDRATAAMERLGLTPDDLLAALRSARQEVMDEAYGPGFLEDLVRKIRDESEKSDSTPTA